MKKLFDKSDKLSSAIILFIIIVIALFRLFYLYSLRDGHHVDETWSYGFANSYYQSQIFGGFSKDTHINIGEWIKGDVFNDYITVSDDHRFAFDSVIYNSNSDLSPALYTLILHFICSFFPGEFSWNFAFAISVLCFVPSLILIYLISYEFTSSRFCGYLSVIYFALSGCGTGNFLYLRVYHMFTLFSLWLLYLFVKILKEEKKSVFVYLLLPFVTLLGSFTHFFYLVIAFCMTLFSGIILLFKKRFKDLFLVGFIMLFSVVLFFVFCPTAFRLIFPFVSSSDTAVSSVTGYYDFPYYFDLGAANTRFFVGCVGFSLDINVPNIISFFGTLLFIAVICFLIYFVFRNEKWMKSFVFRIKSVFRSLIIVLKTFFSGFDSSILIALLTSVLYLLIVPLSASFVNMGFTERYLFCGMTFFIISFTCFSGRIILALYSKRKKMNLLIICFAVVLLAFFISASSVHTDDFMFKNMRENDLKDKIKGRDVYVIIYNVRDMTWLSPVLNECNNVYVELQKDVLESGHTYPELNENTMLMIVKTGLVTDEMVEEIENDEDIALEGFVIPKTEKSIEQIISEIESDSDINLTEIGDYPLFIGHTSLYE